MVCSFFFFFFEDVKGSVSYCERTVGVAQAKKLQFDRETVIFLEFNQLDVIRNIPCGDARLVIFERVKRQEKDSLAFVAAMSPPRKESARLVNNNSESSENVSWTFDVGNCIE